jgi:hypothetical protein
MIQKQTTKIFKSRGRIIAVIFQPSHKMNNTTHPVTNIEIMYGTSVVDRFILTYSTSFGQEKK